MRRRQLVALGIACASALPGMLQALEKDIVLEGFNPSSPYCDTIRFLLLKPKADRFEKKGDFREVAVLDDGRGKELTYKVWMQKKPAPLAFIIPGLGGHCASVQEAGLAEVLFDKGYSVAALSSPFNWEFVTAASTVIVPGHTPRDAEDMYAVMQAVRADIREEYGEDAVTKTALMGYSLGAIEALFIARIDEAERKMGFERILAINPPVNLLHGLIQLDDLFKVWTNWSEAQLDAVKVKAMKIYNIYSAKGSLLEAGLLIEPAEAKFAIGYTFHRTLGETIKAIHSRKDYGFLKNPYSRWSSERLDKEIERYLFSDYVLTFVKAAYSNLWLTAQPVHKLNAEASIFTLEKMLERNDRVRVLHSRDDFLLTDDDRLWLDNVLGDRIVFFDHGAHLGFLYHEQAQEAIAGMMTNGSVPASLKRAGGGVARQAWTRPSVAPGPAQPAQAAPKPAQAAPADSGVITEPTRTGDGPAPPSPGAGQAIKRPLPAAEEAAAHRELPPISNVNVAVTVNVQAPSNAPPVRETTKQAIHVDEDEKKIKIMHDITLEYEKGE
ncbi:hypothetical protein GX586_08385 [bacterium]|nr:hypothetical protein [bacterium]